jgi:PAS domain S-box-containing protein
VEPRKFRLIITAVLAGALLLIWVGNFSYERFVFSGVETELRRDMEHDILLVEEHLSVVLDNVAARLRSVVEPLPLAADTGPLDELLRHEVAATTAIRSISRLDAAGFVVDSSSAANLGVLVPKSLVPQALDAKPGELVLRGVWPYHDIAGLARTAAPESGTVWLASAWFSGTRGPERWVAAINPGFFESFWARLYDGTALKVAVYDYTGRLLMSRVDARMDASAIGVGLAKRASLDNHGLFELEGDQSLLVAYRASLRLPLIVAVVGDRQHVLAMHAADIRRSTFTAIALSLAVVLLLAVVYGWYRRYESSVMEAANEALAIREHVMVSESLADGTTIRVNDALLQVSGFEREELVGQRNSIIDADWHPPAIQQNLWKTIRAGRIWKGTLRDRSKSGQDYWVSATIMPITDVWNRTTRYMVLMSDLTQVIELDTRLTTERQLRSELIASHQQQQRMEQQLRESQKLEAIGQLTGGLAHDFNNLLGIVVGNLDRLDERLPDDAEVRLQHRTALQAALRGAEVTRALLAVARRQPLKVQDHDMNELLRTMVPLLHSTAGSAITVHWNLFDGALWARLDPGGLSNVVLNLVINARDAMHATVGDRTITLRTCCEIVAEERHDNLALGCYAVLHVTDVGAGMSESVRAQAFEPFFTTKERGQGTGLGLAMVYGYASQLGGTVNIQSCEGMGTTVSVYLPAKSELAPGTDGPDLMPAPVLPATAAAGADGDGDGGGVVGAPPMARVLVVDDEPELCALASDWLESLGFSVTAAQSPTQALELLREARFDILFTDVVMPGGMDGLELARKAREMAPDLCVLLASGYAQSLLDASELPGPLLNKPYRKKDIASAMAQVLQARDVRAGTRPETDPTPR